MPGSFANSFVKAIVQSPLHFLVGSGIGVISVKGLRSGKVYATPINLMPDGNGFMAVSLRSRTWWRNLRGGQPAELHMKGQTQKVRGEVVEERELVRYSLGAYFAQHPGMAKYFKVQIATDGKPYMADLEREASERVLVWLRPAQ
jgi:hypothetical protein